MGAKGAALRPIECGCQLTRRAHRSTRCAFFTPSQTGASAVLERPCPVGSGPYLPGWDGRRAWARLPPGSRGDVLGSRLPRATKVEGRYACCTRALGAPLRFVHPQVYDSLIVVCWRCQRPWGFSRRWFCLRSDQVQRWPELLQRLMAWSPSSRRVRIRAAC
jgi:hypothetical protein